MRMRYLGFNTITKQIPYTMTQSLLMTAWSTALVLVTAIACFFESPKHDTYGRN